MSFCSPPRSRESILLSCTAPPGAETRVSTQWLLVLSWTLHANNPLVLRIFGIFYIGHFRTLCELPLHQPSETSHREYHAMPPLLGQPSESLAVLGLSLSFRAKEIPVFAIDKDTPSLPTQNNIQVRIVTCTQTALSAFTDALDPMAGCQQASNTWPTGKTPLHSVNLEDHRLGAGHMEQMSRARATSIAHMALRR